MTTNVVYILGAGFSAPAGLPVIKNFIEKAFDLRSRFPEAYGYFDDVLKRRKEMGWAKNYYDTDLENIEEILSILEMSGYAGAAEGGGDFKHLICDVIKAYTPRFERAADTTDHFRQWAFGHGHTARMYGTFVSGLCGLKLQRKSATEVAVSCEHDQRRDRYTVITLNYDRLLESAVEYLEQTWGLVPDSGFIVYPASNPRPANGRCVLAKLHGGVENGPEGIVPPTWNKGRKDQIATAWQAAYRALSSANEIRIIGYSLPDNDAYFRYLLRAAGTEAENLRRVDVLSLDDANATIRARYEHFITPGKLTFVQENTFTYLTRLDGALTMDSNSGPMVVDLEKAHEATFGQRS